MAIVSGACVPLGPAACSLDLLEMLAASPPRPAETFLCISFEMCQIFVFAPASPHSLDVGRYQHSTVSEGAKKKKEKKKKDQPGIIVHNIYLLMKQMKRTTGLFISSPTYNYS